MSFRDRPTVRQLSPAEGAQTGDTHDDPDTGTTLGTFLIAGLDTTFLFVNDFHVV